ncbi:hypothetical protein CRG98_050371 [Punica granatum]|uniref:Uncharacterized protein n=1 Tax=Punica granatum TaxID=22663 RepID=A0A2I0GBR6_PUNGR|nr:hypothetical protein CRG98_050371 [Punica granatum]
MDNDVEPSPRVLKQTTDSQLSSHPQVRRARSERGRKQLAIWWSRSREEESSLWTEDDHRIFLLGLRFIATLAKKWKSKKWEIISTHFLPNKNNNTSQKGPYVETPRKNTSNASSGLKAAAVELSVFRCSKISSIRSSLSLANGTKH